MEDNPLWSRRGFLGMGVGVLGAAGLAACGGNSESPTKVQPEVPKELLDAAASLKGSSMGVLSQKLYSEAANEALDSSIKKFADATGTKIENSLVQADAGDVVAKIDAEVKGGVARDLAFMTDSRFVAQFHALGDLEDVTDVVKALTAKYGEPTAEAKNFCVFDGKWFAIPYHFIGIGSFLRKDWMQEKGIAPKDVYTWEELRDLCLAISDPAKRRFGWGMTVNRSGDANGMIEALINSYGGSIASNDGTKVTFDSPETVQAVTFLGDIYTNPKYKPMLPPGVASLDRLQQQRELARRDPRLHPQPVQRLRGLQDQEEPGLRQHPRLRRLHRAGDRQAPAARPVPGLRRLQGRQEPRARQAPGAVPGQRARAARGGEGGARPGDARLGEGLGRRPVLHQRRPGVPHAAQDHPAVAAADHEERPDLPAEGQRGPAGRRRRPTSSPT